MLFFQENGNVFKNIKFFIFHFSISHHLKRCRIINKPVEPNDPTTSYNFDFLIYQVEEDVEEDCDTPDELARLLEHESKDHQPHEVWVKAINLGTQEENKEVKIGITLEEIIKGRLVKFLQEYVDMFA